MCDFSRTGNSEAGIARNRDITRSATRGIIIIIIIIIITNAKITVTLSRERYRGTLQ